REVVFTETYTKTIENDAFCVPENVGKRPPTNLRIIDICHHRKFKPHNCLKQLEWPRPFSEGFFHTGLLLPRPATRQRLVPWASPRRKIAFCTTPRSRPSPHGRPRRHRPRSVRTRRHRQVRQLTDVLRVRPVSAHPMR